MLCTMRLARRLAPGLGSYRLSVVANHLGVTYRGAAHRAEADAQVTVDVLHTIADRVLEQHRLPTLDPELLRQVTGWPARDVPTKLTQCLRRDTLPHRAPLGAVR
jgi:DNA polymerase-3 subunit epsilon